MNKTVATSGTPPLESTLARLADQCVLCGLCLPHCPTYALDKQESESPRGRISLIHALAEKRIDPATLDFTHLDHCLGCRRCEAVCPAKVDYGRLLIGGRQLQREQGQQHADVPTRLAGWLLAHPAWMDCLLGLLQPFWRWLPRRLRSALPKPPARQALAVLPIKSTQPIERGRVGLFRGCVSRRYSASAQQATIDLLQHLDWTVVIPDAQTCCGAQAAHAGDAARANRLATGNHRTFDGIETVVTLDSGCHEALSQSLDADAIDLLALLDRDPALDDVGICDEPTRIAVFAPCTQRNVVRSDDALRRVLARLPGVDVVWLQAGCCGAAGDHMLRFPDRAAAMREPLLQQLIDSGCERLLVANTGCQLHLQVGVEQHGSGPVAVGRLDIRVQHPVEFIAERLLLAPPSPKPPRNSQ
ncbi:MAG: (Fe-S)-binding protein [Lysobacteraceae bacterium]